MCSSPRNPFSRSSTAVALVAITDCISSLPSALSTATLIVLWWTSRPMYFTLSMGVPFVRRSYCCHSNCSLLRKGRPFILRGPAFPVLFSRTGTEGAPSLRSLQGRVRCCLYDELYHAQWPASHLRRS